MMADKSNLDNIKFTERAKYKRQIGMQRKWLSKKAKGAGGESENERTIAGGETEGGFLFFYMERDRIAYYKYQRFF